MSENNNSRQAIRLPLLFSIALALGVFIGSRMGNPGSAFNSFEGSMSKFREVLSYIENDYVDEVDTEAIMDEVLDEMLEEVIEETLQRLDPHTSYISTTDIDLIRSQLQGNFEGIGIEFNIFKDTIYVVAPLSGGPSEKVGLLSGDKIVKVDGETIAGVGFTNRDVVSRLRGEKGSAVNVSIKRSGNDDLLNFEIIRDVIPQYSVDVAYMADPSTGYMKVSKFSATTYMEFKEALLGLQEKGMQRLILDLTGNTGGYLDRAVDMVDEILEDGKLIVYTEGKESRYNERHVSRKGGDFEAGSLIVLIDEGSASASEIVSGAIQDHDRGLIVGRRSFGKGLVQLPIALNDGSELRLTISRYYTPSGRCIQKPYGEDLDEYYRDDILTRYESGEVFHEDSIKINKELTFLTAGGRKVYGGGGIIPDHFVPIDTTGNSAYLNRLFSSNSIAEYSLNYYKKEQANLEAMGLENFLSRFEVSDQMLQDLAAYGASNGVEYDEDDFMESKALLTTYLKAFIGRSAWNNEGFYPVWNEQNEIYQRALNLFEEADALVTN
ncbi:MAG: S41 family peptidase [Cytophagales bacterium]|nr:S41 family peptidase [Cytophagales bacterium]